MTVNAICLMGPTATGKTELAIALCKRFPTDIVSVDSALVYRGMDIGTAKPDPATLARFPHRLVNIRDPEAAYSAGDFVRDAHREILAIAASGRIPLLVGGTMMYFRSLTEGIASLPGADAELRAAIDAEADELGWPAMHAKLTRVDAASAARIEPNDRQRIQRALEVFQVSGRPLSAWQADTRADSGADNGADTSGGETGTADVVYHKLALGLSPRSLLHQRIERRLDGMFREGFLAEVSGLMVRPGLTAEHPSMRAVGYRQVWSHLAGEYPLETARQKALAATRQLAKRQLTWLRSDASIARFDALESRTIDAISVRLAGILGGIDHSPKHGLC